MQTDEPMSDGQVRGAWHTTMGVGLVYLMAGSLWIWLSDHLVETLSRDPDWLVSAQRYKGLVYVVATTLALVLMVHAGYRRLLALQQRVIRSDLRVRDLFEKHPQPMWVYDMHSFAFLRVNDAALAAYGYSRHPLPLEVLDEEKVMAFFVAKADFPSVLDQVLRRMF